MFSPYPVFLSPWWPAERGLLFAHLLQFHQDQRLFLEQLDACPKIQDPSESLTRTLLLKLFGFLLFFYLQLTLVLSRNLALLFPHLLSLRFWWLLAQCVVLRHCQIVGHGNKTGVVVGHEQPFQSVKLFHQLITLIIKNFIHLKTFIISSYHLNDLTFWF